ncbi:MAG: selenide,water dikinase, partial [Psychromonas sp.]
LQKAILADPQTSGGLLVAVHKNAVKEVQTILSENGLGQFIEPIGYMKEQGEKVVEVG